MQLAVRKCHRMSVIQRICALVRSWQYLVTGLPSDELRFPHAPLRKCGVDKDKNSKTRAMIATKKGLSSTAKEFDLGCQLTLVSDTKLQVSRRHCKRSQNCRSLSACKKHQTATFFPGQRQSFEAKVSKIWSRYRHLNDKNKRG